MMLAATMARREGPVLINRLSRLLGERRMSVAELAEGTGLAYRGLLDLYHDRTTRIELETMRKLCDYLRVTPAALFEWVPPEREPEVADARPVRGPLRAARGGAGAAGDRPSPAGSVRAERRP